MRRTLLVLVTTVTLAACGGRVDDAQGGDVSPAEAAAAPPSASSSASSSTANEASEAIPTRRCTTANAVMRAPSGAACDGTRIIWTQDTRLGSNLSCANRESECDYLVFERATEPESFEGFECNPDGPIWRCMRRLNQQRQRMLGAEGLEAACRVTAVYPDATVMCLLIPR